MPLGAMGRAVGRATFKSQGTSHVGKKVPRVMLCDPIASYIACVVAYGTFTISWDIPWHDGRSMVLRMSWDVSWVNPMEHQMIVHRTCHGTLHGKFLEPIFS